MLKSDIYSIASNPKLLFAILYPIVLILFLRIVLPVMSDFIYLKTGFQLDRYNTVVAITMIFVLPALFGMLISFNLLNEKDLHKSQVISLTPSARKNFLYQRLIVMSFLTFILVLFSIIISNPVPGEGWLRTIFVSFLLSTQTLYIFLFIGSLPGNRAKGLALLRLYGIFLVTVPLGLLLHHPWNYLAFYSPLYWISWTWVISAPVESFIYGAISILITTACILIFFRHYLKKYRD